MTPDRDPLAADARLLELWSEIPLEVRKSLARGVPRSDRDDFMQEIVMLALVHNRSEEIRTLAAFARTTASFLAKRYRRDTARRPGEIDDVAAFGALEDSLHDRDRSGLHRLREILQEWRQDLPPRAGEALRLALEGLGTRASIAETMECTEANVRQLLNHAIERLTDLHRLEIESLLRAARLDPPPPKVRRAEHSPCIARFMSRATTPQ